jgi:hypothetical protein
MAASLLPDLGPYGAPPAACVVERWLDSNLDLHLYLECGSPTASFATPASERPLTPGCTRPPAGHTSAAASSAGPVGGSAESGAASGPVLHRRHQLLVRLGGGRRWPSAAARRPSGPTSTRGTRKRHSAAAAARAAREVRAKAQTHVWLLPSRPVRQGCTSTPRAPAHGGDAVCVRRLSSWFSAERNAHKVRARARFARARNCSCMQGIDVN